MVIQEPVQGAIWHALNHYAYTDAIFLAERLYAEVGSDEALFLLATCYYRSGKPVRAYTLLKNKGCPTSQCKYLLAQCCLEMDKAGEAELTLAGSILSKPRSQEDIVNELGDAACYAFRLLGKIYSKTERVAKAAESYRKSLKLNPFLWHSYQSLCDLGEKPDPSKTFQVSASQNFSSLCQTNMSSPQILMTQPVNHAEQITPNPVGLYVHHLQDTPENMEIGAEQSQICTAPRTHRSRLRSILGGPASLTPLTPSFGVLPLEATPSPAQKLFENTPEVRAPVKKPMTRRSQQQLVAPPKPVFSMSGITNTRDIQTPSPQPGLQSSNNIPGVRRSSRLFTNASSSVKENNKSQSQKKFSSPKAPAKKSKTRASKTPQEMNEINKAEMSENKTSTIVSAQAQVITLQKQSAEGLMRLFLDLGRAYQALAQFDCSRSLQYFSSLPAHHYGTGWVLCQVGRAHFEMAEYQKAEKAFGEVRQLEPHRMEGMETYSTALWHLQREVQLSTLAQDLTGLDKESPQAWCATGNCFSLQKEHDTAIKFFQRAVQVHPNFAYAYTLLGHEYFLTEELDKALACFRNAIRVDHRHYNAWYGIGMIYYKQEKFALAEVHFRKALSINPQSSVLLCHIGVVQHALKKSEGALATLNKAIAADPKNPLCKFHRASILFATDKHKEALAELEELKEIIPKESLVYFLIGKVHKKLGNTHLALMNFSWAMDLDPKGANNQIKEAIDKRYVTDEDDPTTGLEEPGGIDDIGDGSSNNSSMMEAEDVQLQAIESDESL